MLRVLGSPRQLCDGVTRRDFLHVGGLGVGGLTLPTLFSATAARAAEQPVQTSLEASFGRAKQCILLFLYGSPSQLETFDMKPNAPVEVRGTMRPIPSSLPGLDVCEYLPHTAQVMDLTTVVRSVTHPHPVHGVAYATTGIEDIDVAMELAPHDPRHHPYFGSAVEYIERQRRGGPGEFVQNVALPFPFSSQRSDEPQRAGPYPAFLGGAYQPIWTEFVGQGTTTITKARPGFSFTGPEPYLGCTADSYFRVASTASSDVTLDRLDRRRSLLKQFDEARREFDRSASVQSLTAFQQMAYSLIASPKVAQALDVRRESPEVRESYGMTLFGQACLGARRMVEAGTRLVSVFWDEYGLAGDAWDTHWQHFPRMEQQLLPQFDRAYSGLIRDLAQRGMLEDTLVVCLSEHGRTPKLSEGNGGGRDHWSRAYSAIFAGGGIKKGNVVGATDAQAGDVVERPVSPKDLLATMYHLLGIDPHTRLPDRGGRPVPLLSDAASVVPEMLA